MGAHNFTGGEKLQAKLAEMAEKVSHPATLRVGFLEGVTYPDMPRKALRKAYKKRKKSEGAIQGAKGGVLVAMIAAIQEFGAPSRGIRPRPYFRRMIRAKSPTWGKGVARQLKETNYDATKTLGRTGEVIKGQLQQSIRDLVSPPLSPVTVARKGFAKPLIETGHLLASVDYDVKT